MDLIALPGNLAVDSREIIIKAVRSGGPGGQNVNKVSTAVQLSFSIPGSSLPDWLKERLLKLNDRRIGEDGVLLIRASSHRSQLANRREALGRLEKILLDSLRPVKLRKPGSPGKAARERRLREKKLHSMRKQERRSPF